MSELLNYTILKIGDFKIEVFSIFKLLLLIFFVIGFLYAVKRTIYSAKKIDPAKKYSIFKLIKYFVFVIAFVFGLENFGFNLSVLLAGSAALLVGIGLGIQHLFSDYISGIILLVSSSVKVNDVIEVNGLICRVKEINLRTTTVFTREDKYIILPNTDLTRNQIINWTFTDVASRFDVSVGVDYSSDISPVMKILREAVDKQEDILKEPAPFVRFTDFGESSLDFSVFFWTEKVFRVENIKSEIRIRIFEMFKDNNIKIPFPQREIHTIKTKE
jgi:small-conductance mechanosensitive channel